MTLLRVALGESLRRTRIAQGRTLREVSTSARVSLGYLSELERGQKEASSELLAAICVALDVSVFDLLLDISDSQRFMGIQPTSSGLSNKVVMQQAPLVTLGANVNF